MPFLDALGPELLVRAGATTLIVIGATLAIDRFGPKIGGALAGLPIIIGPGFFFIIRDHGAAFAADAAAASLYALSGTEAFLLAYCLAALRTGPVLSLVAAFCAWLVAASALSFLPPMPFLGIALFLASAFTAHRTVRALLPTPRIQRSSGGVGLLFLRGLFAGILVAVVTVLAEQIGSGWSGMLVSFPIGLTVISIAVHQRSGRDVAIAALGSAIFGIASLATFSFVLAVTIRPLGAVTAYCLALIASVVLTSILTGRSRASSA